MKAVTFGRNLLIGVLILFVGALVLPIIAHGATIYVDDDNTGGPWDGTIEHPYQHIQDGINNSGSGDTVFVFNGVYYENVAVNKSIDLTGENRDSTIIDGGGSGDVIYAHAGGARISGFSIQNGEWSGIYLVSSSGNTISGNTIEDGTYGIFIQNSRNNTITRNTIASFFCGIHLDVLVDSTLISENNMVNNDVGVYVQDAHYTIISENTVTNSTYTGIEIDEQFNTVSGNTITNAGYGIFVWRPDNTITGNNITNTTFGIFLNFDCLSNNVTGNIITDSRHGIHLLWAAYSIIAENTITNNEDGINLQIASYNTIENNTITNNTHSGVYVTSSSNNNVFYHNDFINNQENAWDEGTNIWDDGYPSGGNYWDDYTGVDADGDGIGDTPYNIPGGDNQDRYPLTYIRGDANRDGVIELGDIIYLINYVYKNGPAPDPLPAGDTNSDGVVDITDAFYLIDYLFIGGPPPSC